MGFFDLGLSDLFGAGMDLLGDRMQYSYDKRLMREQMKINREQEKWSALHMPTFRRQGFESAGYNPLLAFSSNFGAAQGVGIPNFQSHLGSASLQRMMEANTGREQMQNQKDYNEAMLENARAEVANKRAQTKILKEQAEETRLNNAETRRITEDRNKMSHVIDLLRQRIDYIRSGAGTTRTSVSIPGFFNRFESRDNTDVSGTIHALDKMIQKYGEGSYDALDRDIQFDTLLGGPSAIERDIAKYNRDRNDRIRTRVIDESDPRHYQMVEHAKQQLRLQKEQKRKDRDRNRKEKINNYKVPKAPPKRAVDTYRNLYDVPGMNLFW